MKKLYKSEHDEILTGIIGGVGEYFSIDPTVLRIGFVILVLITGIFPGIIAYIIAYFIIPERPHNLSTIVTPPPMKTPEAPVVEPTPTVQTPTTTAAEEPTVTEIQKDTTEEAKSENTTSSQTQI